MSSKEVKENALMAVSAVSGISRGKSILENARLRGRNSGFGGAMSTLTLTALGLTLAACGGTTASTGGGNNNNTPTPTLGLATTSDTGVSTSDSITNADALVLEVKNLTAGATVAVMATRASSNDVVTGTGTAGQTGQATVTLGGAGASALTEGVWTIAATIGTTVLTSMTTVDRTAPGAATLSVGTAATLDNLVAANVVSNGVTFMLASAESGGTLKWTLTKVGAEMPVVAEQTVALTAAETLVVMAPSDVTATVLTDGTYTLMYTLTDVAGNVRPGEATLGIGTAALALTLETTSDSGALNSDGITNVATLMLAVSGNNGDVVTVVGTKTGDAAAMATLNGTVGVDGMVSLAPSEALSEGEWTFTASRMGDAVTATTMVTVDVTAPGTATLSVGTAATLDNLMAANVVSDGVTFMLASAESGGTLKWTLTKVGAETPVVTEQTVALTAAQTLVVMAPNDVTATVLTDGTYTLMYTLTDVAGNVRAGEAMLGIGAVAMVPLALTLETASDSGALNSDGITNVATLMLAVSGNNGDVVTVVGTKTGDAAAMATLNGTVGVSEMLSLAPSEALSEGEWTFVASRASDTTTATTMVTVDLMVPVALASFTINGDIDASGTAAEVKAMGFAVMLGAAEANGELEWSFGQTSQTALVTGQRVALTEATDVTVVLPQSVTEAMLTAGNYVWMYTVRDVAGNETSGERTVVITGGSTGGVTLPALVLTATSDTGSSMTDGVTNAGVLAFTLTGGTGVTEATVRAMQGTTVIPMTVTLTDGAGTASFGTQAVPLGEGTWQFEVISGDQTSPAVSVMVDRTRPVELASFTINGDIDANGTAAEVVAMGLTLMLAAAETGGELEWSFGQTGQTALATGQREALTASTDYTVMLPESVTEAMLAAGNYVWMYTLRDVAGNEAQGERTVGVIELPMGEIVLPTLALARSADTGTSNTDGLTMAATLSFSLMDGVGLTEVTVLVVQGTTMESTTVPLTNGAGTVEFGTEAMPFGVGEWQFRLTARDQSGAVVLGPVVSVTVDRTASADLTSFTINGDIDASGTAAEILDKGFTVMLPPGLSGGELSWSLGFAGQTPLVLNQIEPLTAETDIILMLSMDLEESDLMAGEYLWMYVVRDAAGNEAQGERAVLVGEITLPMLILATNSDTGLSATDGITMAERLTFLLRGAAGLTEVMVQAVQGTPMETKTVLLLNGDGSVEFGTQEAPLEVGMWQFEVQTTGGQMGATVEVTIDRTAPSGDLTSFMIADDTDAEGFAADVLAMGFAVMLGAAEAGGELVWSLGRADQEALLVDQKVPLTTETNLIVAIPLTLTEELLTFGTYTWMYVVRDAAGNEMVGGERSVVITEMVIVGTLPTLKLTAASDTGASNTDSITMADVLTFELTGAANFNEVTVSAIQGTPIESKTVTLMNGAGTVFFGTAEVPIGVGAWQFEVTGGDQKSNPVEVTVDRSKHAGVASVRVDSRVPSNLSPLQVTQGQFVVNLQSTEPGLEVKWAFKSTTETLASATVDFQPGSTGENVFILMLPSTITSDQLKAGTYTLEVTTTDLAGNENTSITPVGILQPTTSLEFTFERARKTLTGSFVTNNDVIEFQIAGLAPNVEVQVEASHNNGQKFSTTVTTNADGIAGGGRISLVPKEGERAAEGVWNLRAIYGNFFQTAQIELDLTPPVAPVVSIAGETDLVASVQDIIAKGFSVMLVAPEPGGFLEWGLRRADLPYTVSQGQFSLDTAQTYNLPLENGITRELLLQLLLEGEYTLNVRLQDAAGSSVIQSNVVATGVVVAPMIALSEDSDTGLSVTDGITNAEVLMFNLSGGEVARLVEVSLVMGRTILSEPVTLVAGAGMVTFGDTETEKAALTDGIWSVTVMTLLMSETLEVVIDRTAPSDAITTINGTSVAFDFADTENGTMLSWSVVATASPEVVVAMSATDLVLSATGQTTVDLPNSVTGTAGTYNLIYTATDVAGNSKEETIPITVAAGAVTRTPSGVVSEVLSGAASVSEVNPILVSSEAKDVGADKEATNEDGTVVNDPALILAPSAPALEVFDSADLQVSGCFAAPRDSDRAILALDRAVLALRDLGDRMEDQVSRLVYADSLEAALAFLPSLPSASTQEEPPLLGVVNDQRDDLLG